MSGHIIAVGYLLTVTLVTPRHIAQQDFPGGYAELTQCLDDLAFYKRHWVPKRGATVYFRCQEDR
jgi:hypothetical protein